MNRKNVYKCSICNSKEHRKEFHFTEPLPIEKFCKKCKKILPATSFYSLKWRYKDFLSTYCKECDKIIQRSRYTLSVPFRLKRLFLSCKNKAKRDNHIFLITEKDILEQYTKQNGLCFYTGEPLTLERGNNGISLDRINSDLGYILGNIVFTSWKINRMKNNINKESFFNLCKKICEYNHL